MKPEEPPRPSKERMKEAPRGAGEGRSHDPDERALVERSQAGDAAAFGVLVTRHRDRAYGLAHRLTRSAEEAEEVAQDAFVSAWNALRSFRGDAAFGTWLYRIVYRKALDRAEVVRNRGRREVAVDDPARVEAATRSDLDGGGPGADREGGELLAARCERLLGGLSETARAVVTLFYYQDRSVSEVASALGLPEGTVKTHLHRARGALRDAWLEEEGKADDAVR